MTKEQEEIWREGYYAGLYGEGMKKNKDKYSFEDYWIYLEGYFDGCSGICEIFSDENP